MLCPKCGSTNPNDKGFCGDCGEILDAHLSSLVTAIAGKYIREELKDRKVIETEISESVVIRIQNWTKLVLYPATGLLAILTVILTFFGINTVQGLKNLRKEVTSEATSAKNEITNEATSAKKEINNTSEQIEKTQGELDAAQERTKARMSDMDRVTSNAISNLSAEYARAHEEIDQQQQQWTQAGEYELFRISEEDNSGRVATGPRGDNAEGLTLYLLLKKTPLHQSIEIQMKNVTLLPRWAYKQERNVLIVGWHGSPGDSLPYFQVGYVADKGAEMSFHKLVKRDGHVFGDGLTELPQFEPPHPN